jgi:hypothetical protein
LENLEQRIVAQLNTKKYNLNSKQNYQQDISMTSYRIKKKINLVFIDIIVKKNNIDSILNEVERFHTQNKIKNWETYIIVGITNEKFNKSELFYFNGVNIFVNFLLLNNIDEEVYSYEKWIFALGFNVKKIVKEIKDIIT